MKTEFKVGDKIVVVCGHTRKIGKFYNIGDIGIIKHIGSEGIIVNFNNQNNEEVYFTGVCLVRREDIRKYVEQEIKPRFHDAQVGDEVYCRLHGNGIVVDPNHMPSYASVCVSFGSEFRSIYYHIDGRLTDEAAESTLFYRKGKEKYLTERPESEVDWSKASGAKVKVCDVINDKEAEQCIFAFYKPDLEYCFWVYGVDRDDIVYGYKYCSLSEPCKP